MKGGHSVCKQNDLDSYKKNFSVFVVFDECELSKQRPKQGMAVTEGKKGSVKEQKELGRPSLQLIRLPHLVAVLVYTNWRSYSPSETLYIFPFISFIGNLFLFNINPAIIKLDF